jgi:hypothetical protein
MSSTYPEDGAGGAPRSAAQPDAGRQRADVRDGLGHVGEAVRGEAAHFAERTREQVAEQVEAKTEAVTDTLSVFADAVRKAGDELGQGDQTFAAKLASQAADGLQSFSRTLSGKSPEDMLHAARDLGRNNPTAFFAGAVLAGIAIGRFARSSAGHETKGVEPASVTNPGAEAPDAVAGPIAGASQPDDAFGREV